MKRTQRRPAATGANQREGIILLAHSGSGETESTVCVGACCVQGVRPSRRAAAASQTSGRLMAGDRQHLQRRQRPDETRYNIPTYYNILVQ